MKKSTPILSFLIVAVALFTNACSGHDSTEKKSPSEVVKAAYTAANEGRYSEAKKYIHSKILKPLEAEMGTLYMNRIWDYFTGNWKIEKIEILKEEIHGEGAKVFFKLHYSAGAPRDDDVMLYKENGY